MGLSQTEQGSFHSEGPREFVRRVYAEQYGHSSLPAGTPPHRAGLYGALAAIYLKRGNPARTLTLWAELTPFLLMPEETACAALAEYIVYQVEPENAQVVWLTQVISAALRVSAAANDSPRSMAPLAIMKKVAWCDLLEADVRYNVEKETEQIRSALADSDLPLAKD